MEDDFRSLLKKHGVVGVGTGRTVERYIRHLPKSAVYIPSSFETMLLLGRAGLTVANVSLYESIGLYIDGADYFNASGAVIKGKGGALTMEKLLCSMAEEVVIIAQDYKYREAFEGCYVPVEIIPQSLSRFIKILQDRGLEYFLRVNQGKIGPVMTELGNFIVDVEFSLEFIMECKSIAGVVEHGYFAGESYDVMVELFNDIKYRAD
jgi:ribose 5-phosphate isomerase A